VRLASTVTALVALSLLARADAVDPKVTLAQQLTAELDTLARTVTTVEGKLHDADDVRRARARAAYRILRAPLGSDASATDRMSHARRRAAARLLRESDKAERDLLADELAQLHAADVTLHAASEQLPTVTLPTSLLIPAQGTVVRTFGTIVHDRSKTTLARRGIDLEVAPAAQVVAPADGVVRYSGVLRGLDHGVILDHGGSFTVIGKLADVAIPAGTKVTRGDRIGHAARQRVYLELRAKIGPGGLPVDPEPLLSK
jgi:septal ring factor EnvC (AmiA/AmiB activator)